MNESRTDVVLLGQTSLYSFSLSLFLPSVKKEHLYFALFLCPDAAGLVQRFFT
jgi:hypothetical protein